MRLAPWLVAAAIFTSAGAGIGAEADTSDAAFAAKVTEIAPSNSPTPARIISLHRFVRDEIRQVPAQYG